MKKVFLSLLFVCSNLVLLSQDEVFPEYVREEYNIEIKLDTTISQSYDGHLLCDSVLYYEFIGVKPSPEYRWIKPSGGSQNASTTNTPTAMMCRLLDVFATGDIEAFKALYRPQDAAFINMLLSVDTIAESWRELSMLTDKMNLLMSISTDEEELVYVESYHGDQVLCVEVYGLMQVDGQWRFDTDTIRTPGGINVLNFLNLYSAYSMLGTNRDYDNDGVLNLRDNCPCTYNPDQADYDVDGFGDVCDVCPHFVNKWQLDSDGDGVGDECDNCPDVYNADQADTDHDGFGDACDVCPYVFDPQQDYELDSIGNPIGTECNPDIDGDGILNEDDPDMDGDGWLNENDNCQMYFNPDQTDSDNDGIGDDCDNCPLNYNPDQMDIDFDGVGDVCDTDTDGDGIIDEFDNCPNNYNPDQEDENCNGIGDACEDEVIKPNVDKSGNVNNKDAKSDDKSVGKHGKNK